MIEILEILRTIKSVRTFRILNYFERLGKGVPLERGQG
jgi:hypothetical protein